jgi:WD40 repeat protein
MFEESDETKSAVYLIDTTTGEVKSIPGIEDVWSLAWSPDGSQPASLNWPSFRMYTQSTLHINLYDIETDVATSFLRHANFPWGMSVIEVPMTGRNAKFLLAMGGLEPCAAPPNATP